MCTTALFFSFKRKLPPTVRVITINILAFSNTTYTHTHKHRGLQQEQIAGSEGAFSYIQLNAAHLNPQLTRHADTQCVIFTRLFCWLSVPNSYFITKLTWI